MHSRAIATSTLWQLSSQAITLVLSILSIKLVTTALSQSLVGNYQTVYSYLQIFAIIADFGLYAVSVRELTRAENPLLTFTHLLFLRAIITILSLLTAVILAWSLPIFTDTPLPLGISIAVFVPFFTLLAGVFRTLFQMKFQMFPVFLSEVCAKIIPVCLIGLSILFGHEGSQSIELYYAFLAFGSIGSLFLFLLSLGFARPLLRELRPAGIPLLKEIRNQNSGLPEFSPWFSKAEFLRLIKIAAPFGLVFLATTIYRQSDVTLIALLRPEDYDLQNAYYGTVLRLAEVGFLLPTFILNSALPIMSGGKRDVIQLSDFLSKLLLTLLTLGSIISLFSFFFARAIISLVTQDSYLSTPLSPGSDTALQLLSVSIFLGVIVSFCFYLLLNEHRWKSLLFISIFASTLSVVCNSLLIPPLGFVGAGVTTIITHLFLTIGLLTVSLRLIRIRIPFSRLCQWFAFSLVLGLSLFFTAPFLTNSVRTIIFGVLMLLVCFVLLLIFQLLPLKEMKLLKENESMV